MTESQNERVSYFVVMSRIGPQSLWGMQREQEAGEGGNEVTGPTFPESSVLCISQRDQASPMARIVEGPGPAPDIPQRE